jgi:multidrug resistance efflux pump
VLVAQGDPIEEGQLVARLKGQEQAKAAVTAAQLELISAEQSRDEINDHLDLRTAQAQQAVFEAQDAADKAESRLDGMTSTASEKQIEDAEAAVAEAEQQLEQTKKRVQRYTDMSGTSPDSAAAGLAVAAAQKEAVSYLNALQGEPSENDIARAEADLALAQAQLAEAEREYEILQKGPHPNEVALAEARVAAAEDQLAAAQAVLKDLELLAPFSGEIISLNLKAGEVVNPGNPGVVLANLSSWQVITTDLTENDVSLIEPGMEANITLNAFPDRTFTGVVKEIDRQGVESRGAVTYAVTLDFNPEDVPVRWEMTAFVEIVLE